MKKLFVLIIISLSFLGCGITEDLQKMGEAAYFEGQKDAMNGEWKIKKDSDGCYKWIASPWEDERAPIYNISFKCGKGTKK